MADDKPAKPLIRWAVMANDELYPRSVSLTRSGALSYLRDAQQSAETGVYVRLVRMAIYDSRRGQPRAG